MRCNEKKLIVDESQKEEKYRPISSLLQKCHLKEILNQKYIESYENVIFIIGGDLMWAELKARLGLDAYICTGHICHLPFYHHIMQDPLFCPKIQTNYKITNKIALYWPVARYVILHFMMLKSPCAAIKHKINAIWAETFTHWMSVLIFIESKKRGKLIFLLMRSIPSKVSCVWYTASRPVKSPFHSLKSLLPIQY